MLSTLNLESLFSEAMPGISTWSINSIGSVSGWKKSPIA